MSLFAFGLPYLGTSLPFDVNIQLFTCATEGTEQVTNTQGILQDTQKKQGITEKKNHKEKGKEEKHRSNSNGTR